MNYLEEFERIFNETQNTLAQGISTLIRSINDKEKIIEFFRNMKNQPSIDIFRRINKIAIEKEDYETCDAIKEYCSEKNINL